MDACTALMTFCKHFLFVRVIYKIYMLYQTAFFLSNDFYVSFVKAAELLRYSLSSLVAWSNCMVSNQCLSARNIGVTMSPARTDVNCKHRFM